MKVAFAYLMVEPGIRPPAPKFIRPMEEELRLRVESLRCEGLDLIRICLIVARDDFSPKLEQEGRSCTVSVFTNVARYKPLLMKERTELLKEMARQAIEKVVSSSRCREIT